MRYFKCTTGTGWCACRWDQWKWWLLWHGNTIAQVSSVAGNGSIILFAIAQLTILITAVVVRTQVGLEGGVVTLASTVLVCLFSPRAIRSVYLFAAPVTPPLICITYALLSLLIHIYILAALQTWVIQAYLLISVALKDCAALSWPSHSNPQEDIPYIKSSTILLTGSGSKAKSEKGHGRHWQYESICQVGTLEE